MKWLGQNILIVCLPSLVFHLEEVVYCWNCNCHYLTLCCGDFLTFFPLKIHTAQLNSIISSVISGRGQKDLLDGIGGSSFYFLHVHSVFMSVYNLQGAMSVDSITDLDDNQSRLLEALQLSLPAEAQSKKEKARDKKLSLNPIYRQVPRLVDSCCQHLEKHGKQTCLSAVKYWRLSCIQASFIQAPDSNSMFTWSGSRPKFPLQRKFTNMNVCLSPVGLNQIWGGANPPDGIQAPQP